jgi:uncharacterized membrane protein YkvA (DUF1232 family)
MPFIESVTQWAKSLKRDAVMLWFARRHPDTPWLVKGLCFFTVAYVLSPIDLIPDFIPVLGYLDELVLVPAMIWLALRLLPAHVVDACREQAEQSMRESKAKPASVAGAVMVVALWGVAAVLCWNWLLR